ncbi:MAG: N,N-dimethylformamidase beta subunit family domain-containing protein [Thermoleophilaceae bacterium]
MLLALAAPSARADWDYANIATGDAVDAYTSEVSVLPGGTLHFHVSTAPAAPYRIELYRLGPWSGAAPERVACVPSCTRTSAGVPRAKPAPDAATGAVRANWPVTNSFAVPRSWPSGYYVAKVVLQRGAQALSGKLVPFIVRAPSSSTSSILVVAAANTWQAYNNWGGTSLYEPRTHAVKASFDRPYESVRVGGQSLFDWELPLARFIESQGYDVTYTTDVDVDRDPASLAGHDLVVVAGHSEYWTTGERSALEAARDSGVNLFFAGANSGYWHVRYEDGGRTIVGYKNQSQGPYGPDPQAGTAEETTFFRSLHPARPECTLIGIASDGGLTDPPGFDRFVSNAALGHAWFAGTGFGPGASLPRSVGYEWDQVIRGCTPPLAAGTSQTVLFHTDASGTNGISQNDSAAYTAPSGARVFAAGTFEFAWGLDGYGLNASPGRQPPDPRLQQFARNMLRDLAGAAPGALRSVKSPGSFSVTRATRRGIPISVSVRIPGATVSIKLLGGKGSRKTLRLASTRGIARIGGGVSVKPKISRRAARRLGRGRRSTAILSVTVTAPTDAKQTVQRRLVLKR